jgi:hypothetical protein
MSNWFTIIAAGSELPPHFAQQLTNNGFVVMPGPVIDGGCARLSEAYDQAVLAADPADVSVSKTDRSSKRVNDFVNRGTEFDSLYIYPPLLTACCQIIGRDFKLSSLHARTLEPGAPQQPLHVDVRREETAWPLVGFILMVDDFTPENGATRFVPGSHLLPSEPGEVMQDVRDYYKGQVLACGLAGSVIIFNGSVWHGYTANRSSGRRRSIQGAFIPREGLSGLIWGTRMLPETLCRIGGVARYVLNLGPAAV